MTTGKTGRRTAGLGLVAYVIVVAAVVLAPDRGLMLAALKSLQDMVLDLGLGWAVAGRIEFVANIVLIVPIPVLGSVALARSSFTLWVVCFGFGASSVVELVQGQFLPDRTASVADVTANTAGAFFGWALTRGLSRRAEAQPSRTSTPSGRVSS